MLAVYKIVHCEGLLLYVMLNQLMVWNPSLKQARWIKSSSDSHHPGVAYGLGYMSQSSSSHCCDYIILRFHYARNFRGRPPRVEVYQLSSSTWKVINISFDGWFLKEPLSHVSLRGTPYWIGIREDKDDNNKAFLQSFDFSKERTSSTSYYFIDKNNTLVLSCHTRRDSFVSIYIVGEDEFHKVEPGPAVTQYCNYVPSSVNQIPGFMRQDTGRVKILEETIQLEKLLNLYSDNLGLPVDCAFCVSLRKCSDRDIKSVWLDLTKLNLTLVSGFWVKPGNEAMQTRSSSSLLPDHRREGQLQIVDTTSFRGKILPGWTVVNQPRSSGNGSVVTYFIEPGTGRQFSSLETVHRHLTGEVNDRRLTRAGSFFQDRTRVCEGSRTKQDYRSVEYASKGFRLPKGWSVEEVPRKNSHHIDKYYVERKTGKRFRSLVSVERYLKESRNHTDQQLMLLQYRRGHSKDFSLPDGWTVEEKPRKKSSQIDRSYIEPETGNKFRSLAAVERYLQAVGNGTADSVSMVQSNWLALAVNRNDTRFLDEVIDPNPLKKVKWVLTGPGGNVFTANVSGSDVSSSVKQTWSEAFVSLIQDRS